MKFYVKNPSIEVKYEELGHMAIKGKKLVLLCRNVCVILISNESKYQLCRKKVPLWWLPI